MNVCTLQWEPQGLQELQVRSRRRRRRCRATGAAVRTLLTLLRGRVGARCVRDARRCFVLMRVTVLSLRVHVVWNATHDDAMFPSCAAKLTSFTLVASREVQFISLCV